MSLWRVWMAPDDDMATLWTYRELEDGRYEYEQCRLPYGLVYTPAGTLDYIESNHV